MLLIICSVGGILFYSFNKKIENKSEEIIEINEKSEEESLKTENKLQEKNLKILRKQKIEDKICIDPGHQLKGNSEKEEVSPGSNQKKS